MEQLILERFSSQEIIDFGLQQVKGIMDGCGDTFYIAAMESIAQALGYENAQQWFNSKEYIDYLCEKIKQLKLDTYEEELSE